MRSPEEILKVAQAKYAGQGPFAMARGAVLDAQREAIEEAVAKARAQYADSGWHPYYKQASESISATIRALLPHREGQ